MRNICVVTVARSDWGIYRPVLRAIQDDSDLELSLIASGAHLAPGLGSTIDEIHEDGFEVQDRVDMLLASDTPAAVARSMALGTMGFAQVFDHRRPDVLLVLGDRFEMHAAALATVPFQIPVAHIHGGEVTHGAIDDSLRHAITKYSHLHFPSTQAHADRIRQLGEERWRITVSGAPALDNLRQVPMLSVAELEDRVRLPLPAPPLLVTYHPVTRQYEQSESQVVELLSALAGRTGPMVVTRPNVDSGHSVIAGHFEQFCRDRPNVQLVDNLGTQGYFSLMNVASAMVGNSSSGIIEAASFRLPVVNIGIRQTGRPRSANVIDVDCTAAEISSAIETAVSDEFRASLDGLTNVYGDGHAAGRIVRRLRNESLDETLLLKKFCDILPSESAGAPPAVRSAA